MKYLETLSIRAKLTEVESKTFGRLQKVFEGEQLYDRIFDETGHDGISIFRDIWIKADKSLTQIDSYRGFTICRNCHGRTSNESHVLKAVQDFHILFHNEKITTSSIQKLLKDEISCSTVQRNLRKYCTPVNDGRSRTYELLNKNPID